MPHENLRVVLAEVVAWCRKHYKKADQDTKSVMDVVQGAIHCQLGQFKDAEQHLLVVEETRKKIKREVWVIAYARYVLFDVFCYELLQEKIMGFIAQSGTRLCSACTCVFFGGEEVTFKQTKRV